MKKILSALFLTSLVVSSTLQTTLAFSDVSQSHDSYVSISFLEKQKIIQGYNDGTFKPENSVNRAEALKIILEGARSNVPDSKDTTFPDVATDSWYNKYVVYAKNAGIVSGNADGTFAAGRQVSRSEFLKMVLTLNRFKKENWEGKKFYNDVPADAWHSSYMNFAGQSGVILPDANNNLLPGKPLTRAEVADIMYLLYIILNGKNTAFLMEQAEAEILQIEAFMNAGKVNAAKRASELAVDFTQQAYSLESNNPAVVGLAKIARGYDLVLQAFIAALNKNPVEARSLANEAKTKANEAIATYAQTESVANFIKKRADEVLAQVQ